MQYVCSPVHRTLTSIRCNDSHSISPDVAEQAAQCLQNVSSTLREVGAEMRTSPPHLPDRSSLSQGVAGGAAVPRRGQAGGDDGDGGLADRHEDARRWGHSGEQRPRGRGALADGSTKVAEEGSTACLCTAHNKACAGSGRRLHWSPTHPSHMGLWSKICMSRRI